MDLMTPELQALALRLADRCALEDLESCPIAWVRQADDGDLKAWLDTRHLKDERLHAPEVLAMYADSLRWALQRGLMAPSPTTLGRPWLVQPTPAALLA